MVRSSFFTSARIAGVTIAVTLFSLNGISSSPAQEEAALELFRTRIVALEAGLAEVRGRIETDLHAIRQLATGGESLSGAGGLSNAQIEKLVDELAGVSSRLDRTLAAVNDNEFRLLRLEKRIESVVQLGAGGAAVSGPANSGTGALPESSINATIDTASVWGLGSDELGNAPGGSVLPDAGAEEQYQFALGTALKNDLNLAENAFEEFIQVNPDHARIADAHFWLGRMQFQRGSYERAVKTFSAFQTQWPNDSRIEKTTLWIGEAVSNFSSKKDTCELLTALPEFVPDPTDEFYTRLEKLKTGAECNS
jgi:TolA-binding protein